MHTLLEVASVLRLSDFRLLLNAESRERLSVDGLQTDVPQQYKRFGDGLSDADNHGQPLGDDPNNLFPSAVGNAGRVIPIWIDRFEQIVEDCVSLGHIETSPNDPVPVGIFANYLQLFDTKYPKKTAPCHPLINPQETPPEAPISRGFTCSIIVKYFDLSVSKLVVTPFSDPPDDLSAAKSIAVLKQLGVAIGYHESNSFFPEDSLTFFGMAKLLSASYSIATLGHKLQTKVLLAHTHSDRRPAQMLRIFLERRGVHMYRNIDGVAILQNLNQLIITASADPNVVIVAIVSNDTHRQDWLKLCLDIQPHIHPQTRAKLVCVMVDSIFNSPRRWFDTVLPLPWINQNPLERAANVEFVTEALLTDILDPQLKQLRESRRLI